MKIKFSYNDLELLLTKEDREQIDSFPMPSLEQAKMMQKRWENFFGKALVPETPEAMQNGIIMIKPYLKVFKEYPELFI